MKEKLLEMARELARKCYEYEKERKTKNLSGVELIDSNIQLIQYLSELKGFCDALIYAGIFDEKDMDKIVGLVLSDADSSAVSKKGFPSKFAEFIEGLKDIDNLGPK